MGSLVGPMGIAVDSSGNVYVADSYNNRIQKFTPDGQFVTKWGSGGSGDGQFMEPWGIAVDSSDYVYVADTWNSPHPEVYLDGQFVTKWGGIGSNAGEFSTARGNCSKFRRQGLCF